MNAEERLTLMVSLLILVLILAISHRLTRDRIQQQEQFYRMERSL